MYGKAIATVAVWGGVVGLSYFFHSINMLSGGGAAFMVIGAFLVTGALWKS